MLWFPSESDSERLAKMLHGWWRHIALAAYESHKQRILPLYGVEAVMTMIRVPFPSTEDTTFRQAQRRADSILTTLRKLSSKELERGNDLQTIWTTIVSPRISMLVDREVVGAHSAGESASAGMFSAGKVYKRWITQRDLKVRSSHRKLDSVKLPYSAVFSNGCQYPGDPEASPEETVNCRCYLHYTLEG